jgi:hypothetical protein
MPNQVMISRSSYLSVTPPAIERLAGRLTRSLLNKSYESMSVYTSSTGALLQQQTSDEVIWSSLETPDELIALEQAR